MNKEKISFIYPSDMASLELDENGNYLVPEGFEIYRIVDTTEQEIERLEQELSNMEEPSIEELVEEGKISHPYFKTLTILNELKNDRGN